MKIAIKCCTLAMIILITGCVGAAVNTATFAAKATPRDELRTRAETGNAEAQYELGKSYCCMGVGFDTQTATEWLCKAAHQGNTDAMYELGRIYLGDISRTPAPGQKLVRAISARKSHSHAHMWMSVAAEADHPQAHAALSELEPSIDKTEKAVAVDLAENWTQVPCEYDDVFEN